MRKHISELISEVTSWKKKHPDMVVSAVKLHSKNLQYVIETIADDGTYEGIEKKFIIPLSSISRWNISTDQYRIVKNLMDARGALCNAENEFVKLFISEIN